MSSQAKSSVSPNTEQKPIKKTMWCDIEDDESDELDGQASEFEQAKADDDYEMDMGNDEITMTVGKSEAAQFERETKEDIIADEVKGDEKMDEDDAEHDQRLGADLEDEHAEEAQRP